MIINNKNKHNNWEAVGAYEWVREDKGFRVIETWDSEYRREVILYKPGREVDSKIEHHYTNIDGISVCNLSQKKILDFLDKQHEGGVESVRPRLGRVHDNYRGDKLFPKFLDYHNVRVVKICDGYLTRLQKSRVELANTICKLLIEARGDYETILNDMQELQELDSVINRLKHMK